MNVVPLEVNILFFRFNLYDVLLYSWKARQRSLESATAARARPGPPGPPGRPVPAPAAGAAGPGSGSASPDAAGAQGNCYRCRLAAFSAE
jgi:hypothetical protein